MPTRQLSVEDIANYFLAKNDPEAGDMISNLKLQKLCYYAQGFHLAMFNEPLFTEEIEAWQHGPVIPSLYRKYRDYGADSIPAPDKLDLSIYDKKVQDLLDEVYRVFGQFSAWKLRNLTHEEAPWKEAFEKGAGVEVITHASMKEYFKTLVVE